MCAPSKLEIELDSKMHRMRYQFGKTPKTWNEIGCECKKQSGDDSCRADERVVPLSHFCETVKTKPTRSAAREC